MTCPQCHSNHVTKNGFNRLKKQLYKCQDCGRQFVLHPAKGPVSQETRELIDRLLLEKISLAGIARAVKVSEAWLQNYVNEKYKKVPRQVALKKTTPYGVILECDELWSFVGKRLNKQWIWLAMDRLTRRIVGVHVGDRTERSAQALWDSIPAQYQTSAPVYTDFWSAYARIIPAHRHYPSAKSQGETNHIERFNGTLRQRISRLVRKSLAFSKNQENYLGALWNFIHHYNATMCA
ncbi:IS1 family transposase [Marichromatium bheemlicum]|uniref:IS1 family transposase n=1 Tax=Marichromatium bheemlicum TaxID=365339 RepID=A0ABX1IBL3_9GAMM|nr:IS1 family transposase [Marichromatium bheemlicum]NKN34561.1 IS1 family transposase [Marichromatium bheemlicum]